MARAEAAARGPALAVLGCAAVLVLEAIVGLALGHADGAGPTTGPVVALVLGSLPVGAFLQWTRPANRVGTALCLVGLSALAAVTATAWSGTAAGAWLTQWLWWPPWPLLVAALCLYPTGSIVGSRRRWILTALAAAGGTATLCLAVAVYLSPALLVTGSVVQGPARGWLLAAGVAMVGCGAVAVAVAVDITLRARRVEGPARSQLTALLPAAVLVVGGAVVEALGLSYATLPGLVAVPLGMGAAILAHRLDDLDLVVDRALVWLILTGLLTAAFAGTVALLGATTLADRPLVVSALGSVVVAASFDPLRRRVQRAVTRLLFGDRDRPLHVLTELGRRMGASADPSDLLADLVGAVTESLRVPYARMEVHATDGTLLTVVEAGRAQAGDGVGFPMVAHGEPVGMLRVAPRRSSEAFTSRETTLLTDMAGQAALAARSYRVTLELREARHRLVRSREEERLRIRRDLHDGLGPAIVGARMQVAAAARSNAADDLLEATQETLAECSREIRRIVDGLRPGALDRGLLAALEQRAGAIGPVPSVTVEAAAQLPPLDAAVEVAAFRIITEALANAARHSGAAQVRIRLDCPAGQLLAEVVDDGTGGARARDGGVGMQSMRERAEELGGRLVVDSGPAGTAVRLQLPR